MRRMFAILIMLLPLALFPLTASADEDEAEDISASTAILGEAEDYSILTDGIESEAIYVASELKLHNSEGIAGVYLVFDLPAAYTIENAASGEILCSGSDGFLHCFSDLETAPEEVSVRFPNGAWLAEVRTFSSGKLPDTVQRWEQQLNGGADIVLFSTHGDDEQLYFAGLLPYYAGHLGLDVQVVYMTGHSNNYGSVRQHEMLNGLWAVGVRTYPVFGNFPDFKLPYREATYVEYENLGYSREELLRYVVGNIRRFRPQVAIGHDLNGEYGHGMHRVYADLLTKAVEVSADPEVFPELVERYGVWDVPKTYLHLYGENEIVMDWDQPLDRFGGMTAFQVNQQRGFPCHISQQYDQYVNWLYGAQNHITQASQIYSWSPCYYGLYRSTVGEDVQKNDFMENLTSYAELSRQEEAQVEKLRSAVERAKEAQAVEPKLLRLPEDPNPNPQQQQRTFPALAMLFGLSAVAAAAVLAMKIKKI